MGQKWKILVFLQNFIKYNIKQGFIQLQLKNDLRIHTFIVRSSLTKVMLQVTGK